MRKNDFITAIFEEIKESLHAIDGKLENGQSGNEKRKIVIPKEFIEYLNRSIDQSIRDNVSSLNHSSQDQTSDLNQKLEGLSQNVKELTKVQRKRRLLFRKLVVWQSIFAILLIVGLVLFVNSRQLRDNDLKFRYIEACGGIDSKRLLKLDSLFHVNRDELAIEKIRNGLEDNE
jgi:hypothetical protein